MAYAPLRSDLTAQGHHVTVGALKQRFLMRPSSAEVSGWSQFCEVPHAAQKAPAPGLPQLVQYLSGTCCCGAAGPDDEAGGGRPSTVEANGPDAPSRRLRGFDEAA